MTLRTILLSLRGRRYFLMSVLAMLAVVGIVSMYSFDYAYLISNSGTRKSILVQRTRASFEAYLHTTHREIHKEDIRAYCSQDKFSKAFIRSAEQRYSDIVNGGMEPIFVATNLHNSEKVLPNMAVQLLALADALGHNRTFISIYENGSKDKTKDILQQFNETLNALGIPHRIIADDAPKPEHVHRIEYLAKVRNFAMEPLYNSDAEFGRVVFINDVHFCLTDILELLFQSRAQDAHLTCAEDLVKWYGGPGFYDTWVARDIKGERFIHEMHRLSKDDVTMVAQMRDRPFQVQCGWNGMAVIDAKVFRGDDGLRFRRSAEGECSASECSLFCNDMWKHGFNRIVMVPRVKLTYDIEVRNMIRRPLYFPADTPFNLPEVEKISFRSGPKKVLCRPLNGVDSHNPDGPEVYVDL